MKKFFFLMLTALCFKASFCQEVSINGSQKNRLLTWDDFTGKPDNRSEHEANTYWKINYSFQGISFNGDTVKLKGLSVKIELDAKQSWIKPGKQTDNLLNHEQGHFNIGLLCQKEILAQFNNRIFFKSDWQNKLQTIFNDILSKYTQMGVKYDQETNHSQEKEMQRKWDTFFTKELSS